MTVDTEKLRRNANRVVGMCAKAGIAVWGVTKGMAGDPRLAKCYAEAGLVGICDSRVRNLADIRASGVALPLQSIRISMPSELEALTDAADVSVQSEIATIRRLDEHCLKTHRKHAVLIMIDIGDLREGFWPDELDTLGQSLRALRGGVSVAGVATNFACASGVLPSGENLRNLVKYRDRLRDISGLALPTVSVGGTCCLKMIEEGGMPGGVNQIRVGEALLIGQDTAFSRRVPGLEEDVLAVQAEIVECRIKPSLPVGETGFQAFGEKPVFVDRGLRRRALLGIGRQDTRVDRLTPLQEGVEIVAASSDHMIVDITDAPIAYRVGDVLAFRPLYPAMLAAATSRYVSVDFI